MEVKGSNKTKTHFGVPVNKPVEKQVAVPAIKEQPIVEKIVEVLPKKRKWKFDIERDWEGLIKTVIVTEI